MQADSITFARQDDGRVVAGVALGFARRHGLEPAVVRGALVVLTFAAGLGLVLYALGAVLSHGPRGDDPVAPALDARRNVAVVFIAVGLIQVVRATGVWLGDQVMVPLVAVVAGLVVLGMVRTEEGSPSQLAALMTGRHARARITVGAVLVASGLGAVALSGRVSGTVRVGAVAAALSVVGVVVMVGPWIAGLAQSVSEERRRRIRSEEREVMAAHLHDSVLQTLALIQRNADDPRRTAALARQQEHELRRWLYGADTATATSLAAAVAAMAEEVEHLHEVRIEVVTVGDADRTEANDEAVVALVAATREACVNAAKHSGQTAVSVYAEVAGDRAEVFVKDRGVGFDPASVDADRMGIQQSMVGRLARVGGAVVITSEPRAGTEVHLSVPLPSERLAP